MTALDQVAKYTTYQNQLANVAAATERERQQLVNAIAICDTVNANIGELQTEFFELSVKIDELLATDPTNQALINQHATKQQQIPDFTDVRDQASGMGTALDPWRSA